MTLRRHCALLFLLVLPVFGFGSCGSAAPVERPEKFVCMAIPDNDETRLRERFEPLAVYLAEELDIAVEYKPVSDHANAVNAMSTGEVFLAWFRGLSGVQARCPHRWQGHRPGEENQAFYSCFITDHLRSQLSPRELPRLRRATGFVHQNLDLVPGLRVLHNLMAGDLGLLGNGPAEGDDFLQTHACLEQVALFATTPRVWPQFLVYFFYRWETCLCETAILGLLATQAIGFHIQHGFAFFQYDRAMVFILVNSQIVIGGDFLEARVRRGIRARMGREA